MDPISIPQIIASLPGAYVPRDLATVNDAILRVARLEGAFPFHTHDEDELFLCWDGTFRIELADQPPVTLSPGELCVVPKGTSHRPIADAPAHALLIERPDTRQY